MLQQNGDCNLKEDPDDDNHVAEEKQNKLLSKYGNS